MIHRIFATDPEERMPQIDSNRKLTAAQKETLKRWVAEGAAYEPHWAFVPPVRPAVPATKGGPAPRNPIDAFILATLENEGLQPAPEADRRTLIRRLSLDLTGLPPAPPDVEAFVRSRDPQAYEQLVRQYLASPHYGSASPRGRSCAMPTRLAFTTMCRSASALSRLRDRCLQSHLPFDQFTREQLAGDLLPDSPSQRIASGYNRLHRISAEGIQNKYLAKYSADRFRTTSTVWLGATMACAECHDHKFDPFTIKALYRFAALFSDLKEKGAYNLSGGFTRENLTEEMIFASPAQQQRMESLDAEIVKLRAEVDAVTDAQLAASRAEWEAATLAAAEAGARVVGPARSATRPWAPLAIEEDNRSCQAKPGEQHLCRHDCAARHHGARRGDPGPAFPGR